MRRTRRMLVITGALGLGLVVTASIALWIALSVWAPVRGKALIIRKLEERWPVQVSIQQLRCPLWHGVLLEQIEITGRATHERWGVIPSAQLRVNWLTLVFARHVALRGVASVQHPFQGELTLSADYRLEDGSLRGGVTTSPIPLRTVTAPLKRFLPSQLIDGTVRLDLSVAQPSLHSPVAVEAAGEGLVWKAPSWTLQGDAQLRGTMTPGAADRPWTYAMDLVVRQGTLEGLRAVGRIEQLAGTASLRPAQVDIRRMQGTALGAVWTLEGTAIRASSWSFEALLASRAPLTSLTSAFPALADWQPQGAADARIVCRGPFAPVSAWDCLAQAAVERAALTIPRLQEPLTDITARLRYELLTRRLGIETLQAQWMGEPLIGSGRIELAPPAQLSLHVLGGLPLERAEQWLADALPVQALQGRAAFDLQLDGPIGRLTPTGTVILHEAAAHLMRSALRLTHVDGTVRLAPAELTVSQATARLNDLPLTLDGALTRGETPRFTASVEFPNGRARLAGQIRPHEIFIEPSRLWLGASQAAVQGRVSRALDQPSALDLSGAVELQDLTALVFIAPWLNTWKLQGLTDVRLRFEGALARWQDAVMTGQLQARELRIRDVPVTQVVCRLEQNPKGRYVKVLAARVADGTFVGELAIERRPSGEYFLLQADVTGMQLAQLTRAVPAWAKRAVTGDASAHATVSGTAAQRATWRGEGWLNASGRQLGDIPLLDKLFGGLFGMLGDRLGLESLRRAEITSVALQWQLANERVLTDSLRLGGMAGSEPVAIYGRGEVGLDGRLDVVIEPELSEGVLAEAPALSSLAGTVLKAAGQLERLRRLIGRHHVTGTIRDPEYRFELTMQEIFKQLTAGAAGGLLQQLFDLP